MSKQPSRGHISVRGPTYWAFREACQEANIPMGRLLDKLIMAELDQISFNEPTLGVTSPEELLARFHHTFSVPNPPKSFCSIDGNMGICPEEERHKFPTEDEAHAAVDPYHVEVSRRPPAEWGLFSEAGIKAAEAEPKAEPRKAKAKGTKPPSFHEIASCIDPTFGKK